MTDHYNLNLKVIGNGTISALIDQKGTIVWSCFPRLDGDPIFCSLLRNREDLGYWKVELYNVDPSLTKSEYIGLSTTVRTTLQSTTGDVIEIIDFAPRYRLFHRTYRPNTIVRAIRPLAGSPRIRIRIHPTFAYGWGTPERTRGSNHIRYLLANQTVRLTTNVSVTFIMNELWFNLEEPAYVILMPDESLTISPSEYFADSIDKTSQYWEAWAQSLNTPLDYQEQVIRASIILKLSSFEESGAIIQAMTTSIAQDSLDSGCKIDERFCYIRTASQAVRSLNALNATSLMADFLKFINNITTPSKDLLQPVFGIGLENRLPEKPIHRLAGYRGFAPVKVGTQNYKLSNNSVYGAIILSFVQMFFDDRFAEIGHSKLFGKLEEFGEKCISFYNTEDYDDVTGLPGKHTLSTVYCWAGCDRLAKIAEKIGSPKADYWRNAAAKIFDYIQATAWNEELQSFATTLDPPGPQIRGDLLWIFKLNFLPASDERTIKTLATLEKYLTLEGPGNIKYLKLLPNDATAHVGVNCMYIQLLYNYPERRKEAYAIFNALLDLGKPNSYVYAERFDPETREMWGNYPHITAMAGIIDCAMLLSRPWSSVV